MPDSTPPPSKKTENAVAKQVIAAFLAAALGGGTVNAIQPSDPAVSRDIADIRERVARMEAILEIQRKTASR